MTAMGGAIHKTYNASIIPPQPPKKIKQIYRSFNVPARRLQSEADIDAYVNGLRSQLKDAMKGVDIVEIK